MGHRIGGVEVMDNLKIEAISGGDTLSQMAYFSKLMERSPAPAVMPTHIILHAAWINNSPLGPMLAVADDHGLYLLEFIERRGLEGEIKRLCLKGKILLGKNAPIDSIEWELKGYFEGALHTFQTPIHILGTPFQRSVWAELLRISYGETSSYLEQARALNKPKACRAVANANGRNQLALIIPCHRIIQSNGMWGGYAGGVMRKQWLLEHEKKYVLRTPL